MKRFFLIFICLALLGTLCACRVRLIADPALADTILQEQQPEETQPPTQEETAPPEQEPEEDHPAEQEPEKEPPAEETPPDTPPQPDETAQAEEPDTSASVAQTGTAVYTEQLAAGVTVTYDPNGGDSTAVSASVTPGQPYGVQPEAVRRGYAFDGWWTLSDGGEQILPETIVSDMQAHTLYAHWQRRDAATLTFDPNGGRIKSKEATVALSDGDCYGTLPVPLREGYDFNGWWTQMEGGEQILPETVFSGTDDRTVYAHWTYDPLAFWTFTLQNKTQQIYLCQQTAIYFETETDGVTQQYCDLITATGSFNIAENRDDVNVTDDWVQAKKPQVILKCADLSQATSIRASVQARFPEQQIILVSPSALWGDEATVLYAKLALAKYLYSDWYTDVDLAKVAQELNIDSYPISFS